MGRSSVLIYLLIAVLILLFLSHNKLNNPQPHHRHRHRRLKVRSNFTFTQPTDPPQKTTVQETLSDHHISFDPVVAEIERKREDKQWEQHYIETHHPESVHHKQDEVAEPEWEEFKDAEEFLNDERKFNLSDRLETLFPKVDVNPTDGFVSESELAQWNYLQSLTEVIHRTEREMATHDKNKDGFVSFAEYHPMKANSSDNNSSGVELGWWQEDHFNASDADGDGMLNIAEFKDFLHSGDTKNPKLLLWLCQEEIRETDTNKDGKLDFKEFFDEVYDMIRNYDEEDQHTLHRTGKLSDAAKKMFIELDRNGDGSLSDVELLPVIGKLHPSEHFYANQQAYYAMQQADSDKDGRLTLKEMVENPYAFYTSIYKEDEDDEDYDDDGYGNHDEFR